MSHFINLPNELLNDIVTRIRDTSPDSLLALSLTCKELEQIVRRVQKQHAKLLWRLNKSAPIARFMEAHHCDQDIKFLRLIPQKGVLNAFRVQMDMANYHVEPLCRFLAGLSQLATFSLYMNNEVDLQSRLPGPVIARIVRALPSSVVNLEIDTEGIDRIGDDEVPTTNSDHLCTAISDCLPRLHSLWLRLSCICTDLFREVERDETTQPTSALRRAFIRLDVSPGREHHLGIVTPVLDCRIPRSSRLFSDQGFRRPARSKDIWKHLLGLQTAGAFPCLERFVLFSWNAVGSVDQQIASPDRFFQVYDVASRSVTRYPKYWAKDIAYWGLPGTTYKDSETFFMIRDHEDTDYYGDRDDIEAAILHDVEWSAPKNGTARYPPHDQLLQREPRLRTSGLILASKLHKLQIEEEEKSKDRQGEWEDMMIEQVIDDVGLPFRRKVQHNPLSESVVVDRF